MDFKKSKAYRMTQSCLSAWFIALTCVLGEEGEDWCKLELDIPELLDPYFSHQN